jgi:diacylglycerol diphosphate phosphatase/phosphatidate phosphatase
MARLAQFRRYIPAVVVPKTIKAIRYAGEALTTIGLFVFAFGLHQMSSPMPLTFLEQDMTLSYPLVRPETVPTWLLFLLSISIPTGFVTIGHIWHAIKRKGTPRHTVVSLSWCLLGIMQALGMVFTVTNLLKYMTGRQRPNFYALCDYAGYREAVATGNMDVYNAATKFGAIGNVNKCTASFKDVAESLRSFPSGHSSVSFAGMTFASLYLRASFGVVHGVHVSMLAILSTFPLIVSAWIAISRVRDRWHNTDDVFIGSAIGILCGYLAWKHYVTLRREGIAPRHGGAHIDPAAEHELVHLKISKDGRSPVVTAVLSPSPSAAARTSEFTDPGAITFAIRAAHQLARGRYGRSRTHSRVSVSEDPILGTHVRSRSSSLPVGSVDK